MFLQNFENEDAIGLIFSLQFMYRVKHEALSAVSLQVVLNSLLVNV